MDYLPLPDQAVRQLIDATTIFEAWPASQKQAGWPAHRPDMKRRRDARQADIVQAWLDTGAPT